MEIVFNPQVDNELTVQISESLSLYIHAGVVCKVSLFGQGEENPYTVEYDSAEEMWVFRTTPYPDQLDTKKETL